MIKFECDCLREDMILYVDENGIEEMIGYLKFIQSDQNHMHLIVGNELSEGESQEGYKLMKHVKMIYV